jgi:hypothetical protein
VKTTRYPEAGPGVGEAEADAFVVGEVVPAEGAEHAERNPMRKITAG